MSPKAKDHSWWSFRNVYFLDNMTDNLPEPKLHKDIPAGLHMMNHVYRCFLKPQIIHRSTLMQECQLHETGTLHQMLSQHRACSYQT